MLDWASLVLMSVVVGVELGGVSFAAMKMPWVASVACWRKTVGEWWLVGDRGSVVPFVSMCFSVDC